MELLVGITPEELQGKLHVGQPDSPELGTLGTQQLMDAHPELLDEKLNDIVDAQNLNNTATQEHIDDTENPHGTTKAQIGLGNVDNTSDTNKPVSTAQQTALNLKVDKITGKGLSTNDYDASEKAEVAKIASKANTTDMTAALALKVDKVTGKGLSTNDFTNADKFAIETIADKANTADVLTKTNTTAFTPTAPHHPATKKYADDLALAAGAVTSVFGRSGAVLPQTGDYTATMVGAAATSHGHEMSGVTGLSTALAAKADKSTLVTATLTAAGWASSTAPYAWEQTVTIAGILEDDKPSVDLLFNGTTAEEINAEQDSYGNITRMVTGANSITAYCVSDAPTVDLQIQLKVVR